MQTGFSACILLNLEFFLLFQINFKTQININETYVCGVT